MRARALLRRLLRHRPTERVPDARPSPFPTQEEIARRRREIDPERDSQGRLVRDASVDPPTPEEIRKMEWEEAEAAPHIDEATRADAEDAVNAALWPGMPPVWRCLCGGRPFVGTSCSRCGRTQAESEKFDPRGGRDAR